MKQGKLLERERVVCNACTRSVVKGRTEREPPSETLKVMVGEFGHVPLITNKGMGKKQKTRFERKITKGWVHLL